MVFPEALKNWAFQVLTDPNLDRYRGACSVLDSLARPFNYVLFGKNGAYHGTITPASLETFVAQTKVFIEDAEKVTNRLKSMVSILPESEGKSFLVEMVDRPFQKKELPAEMSDKELVIGSLISHHFAIFAARATRTASFLRPLSPEGTPHTKHEMIEESALAVERGLKEGLGKELDPEGIGIISDLFRLQLLRVAGSEDPSAALTEPRVVRMATHDSGQYIQVLAIREPSVITNNETTTDGAGASTAGFRVKTSSLVCFASDVEDPEQLANFVRKVSSIVEDKISGSASKSSEDVSDKDPRRHVDEIHDAVFERYPTLREIIQKAGIELAIPPNFTGYVSGMISYLETRRYNIALLTEDQKLNAVEKLKQLKLERQNPIGICEVVNLACDRHGFTKEATANQMPRPLPQQPVQTTKEQSTKTSPTLDCTVKLIANFSTVEIVAAEDDKVTVISSIGPTSLRNKEGIDTVICNRSKCTIAIPRGAKVEVLSNFSQVHDLG
jgi:hypothetical protein